MSIFANRTLLVATKHQKEKIMAPLFFKNFQMNTIRCEGLDTDEFGTFSGEKERILDPMATARLKCDKAHELSGLDLIIASEGSFGPDPQLAFLPCNEEVLLVKDYKNNLEIPLKSTTFETNFSSFTYTSQVELDQFLQRVKFPSHRVIIKKSASDTHQMIKGIASRTLLMKKVECFVKEYGSCFLETDMRAMYNPTRRKHLRLATKKLIQKMKSICPHCARPGFAVTDVVRGLPCGLCHCPTSGILEWVYTCQGCSFSMSKKFPLQKKVEDPMYCDNCNP